MASAVTTAATAGRGGLIGLWHRAFPLLTVIGGVRAGLRSHDVRVPYYDERDSTAYNQRRPLLVTERMTAATIGALTYPYFVPMLIWGDLSDVEIFLRGLDPKKYNREKRSMFEAIF